LAEKAERKKKRESKPFWKKMSPELQSVTSHIGKIIDNSNLRDVADAIIMGALAYLGFETFQDWRGAIVGPVGYKLATTMGGTPPVSQITGLGLLGALGLLTVSKTWVNVGGVWVPYFENPEGKSYTPFQRWALQIPTY
jgi:hypothetical protein